MRLYHGSRAILGSTLRKVWPPISVGRKKGVSACLKHSKTVGTKFDLRKHSETSLDGSSYCCKSGFGSEDVDAEESACFVEDVPGNTSEDSGFKDFTDENCPEIKSEISAAEIVRNDIKLEDPGQVLLDCNE